ncbi:MAG: rhodanese-like domain-containing protein [Acidobacteriota bacterium]
MNYRRHIVEALTLVAAAALCATVANGLASRERKLSLAASVGVVSPRKELTAAPRSTSSTAAEVPASSDSMNPAVSSTPTSSSSQSGIPATVSDVPPAPGPKPSASSPAATPSPTTPSTTSPVIPAGSENAKVRFPPHKDVAYVEIDGPQAEWLYKKGVLFLDARRTSVYEAGHIPGALPFSVWESDIDQKTEALYGEGRDGEAPVVAYCSGGDCEDSHMLAQKLWGLFFNNVLVYKGGFPEWTGRGNPSKSGPQP